jgi:hypothetical protein
MPRAKSVRPGVCEPKVVERLYDLPPARSDSGFDQFWQQPRRSPEVWRTRGAAATTSVVAKAARRTVRAYSQKLRSHHHRAR